MGAGGIDPSEFFAYQNVIGNKSPMGHIALENSSNYYTITLIKRRKNPLY